MKVKCDYCGNMIDDQDEKCPYCAAPNNNLHRTTTSTPKTIEELKAYCAHYNMPLEKMRFFIGEDYRGAKAFGIYKDGENYVVYKNKADGTRTIRYEGKDEAYAVNELYMKLRDVINDQREYQAGKVASNRGNRGKRSSSKSNKSAKLFSAVFCLLILLYFVYSIAGQQSTNKHRGNTGYYVYEGDTYYRQGDDWYYYDGYWREDSDLPQQLYDDPLDYYESATYSEEFGSTNFEDSAYYDPSYYNSDTSDSDSYDNDSYDDDWSSDTFDSWDSGGTDWDSDW